LLNLRTRAALFSGVERQPLKELEPDAPLRLIGRWRNEAVRAGRDAVMLMRVFLGRLRGDRWHCG
jgi:hypothetical protein